MGRERQSPPNVRQSSWVRFQDPKGQGVLRICAKSVFHAGKKLAPPEAASCAKSMRMRSWLLKHLN